MNRASGSEPKKVKHENPYHPMEEQDKHQLFEQAWSKKTAFGNFTGMWDSGRIARQNRVKERVESFVKNQVGFVKDNGLPLQASYIPERDKPNHPYTGLQGKGEPVKYLDHKSNERQKFAITLQDGSLQEDGIKTAQEKVIPSNELGGKKVMFTRRGSNAGSLLAMIKETRPERVQHSTFNAGMEVANAGFINLNSHGVVESFKLSSGHYAPNADSGVKLAMWGEQHGAFNPGAARILDHSGKELDTSMPARMFAVQSWATKNGR